MSIYYKISELIKENKRFAVATVIESKGSVPAHNGKMIVLEDGSIIGTIGGGLQEKYVISESIKAIKEKKSKIIEYILNRDVDGGLDMLCGGEMKVFIEINNPRPKLVLVGAGHVSKAIAKLSENLEFDLIVVDDRKKYCSLERFPTASRLYNENSIENMLKDLHTDLDTYIVIATRDNDELALQSTVEKEYAYLGLIGSKRKVKIIMENLVNKGINKKILSKISAPIGLDIASDDLNEIAFSILSEILMIKNKKTAKRLRSKLYE